ncbi:MAG: VIT1/CCC1 transporter family protein [Candidatus Saccharimonadales bacterium]|nr:VIT1/CCC1 transporter family protein [Candidatus Saccharimonadales bacterium]
MLFKQKTKLPFDREYFLALLGGLEGGLATTTAIVVGLIITTEQREIVVTTAIISFMVQAFNSSVGRFSAAHTDDEIDRIETWKGYRKPVYNALLQFTSHILVSLLVILPIVFVSDIFSAVGMTISITLILLFVIGLYKGILLKLHPFRDAAELFILGSLVISVGMISGLILS